MCATAATSASGFYEPVDNSKARPFYKSPPHHVSGYKAEETYKPVYEPAEYKPIAHAPVPEYKPIEHVTEPVHRLPEYKVPEYVPPPSHMYKHEPSYHDQYNHEQASSFQNVAYKVTQQAYRQPEHKPHNSPLYS